MSYYYYDLTKLDNDIVVYPADGSGPVVFPETSVPIQVTPQLISDGGRLADSIDYEGSIQGVKHTITLKYNQLNKEHFDLVYGATMKKYEENKNANMFFSIKVPTHTPNGVKTFTVYLGASSFSGWNCSDTTEKLGGQYARGGLLYDELHENIEIVFIEK